MRKNILKKSGSMFIICNLFIAIFALSYLVNAQSNLNPPQIDEGTSVNPEAFEKSATAPVAPGADKNAPQVFPFDSSSNQQKLSDEQQQKEKIIKGVFHNISWDAIIKYGGIGAGLFIFIGSVAGGKDGEKWGAIAGGVGGAVAGLLEARFGQTNSILIGTGIAAAIFLLTYKKEKEDFVEFSCLPWQAPIGGEQCQLCNTFKHCSEYMCKSLGQACDIVNAGTSEQACIWKNPQDVNSPLIKMTNVSGGHKIIPNNNIRPPATGVIIEQTNTKCIRAFFPLSFTFTTRDIATGLGEPSQCKIDYNLTKSFNDMQFYVGGDSAFLYNHTEKLSLPGPAAIAAVAPQLKNDGEYTLFIRCQDANGNFNQDAYSVSFCVDKGPDTTPPLIVDTNVPSGNPISFNKSQLDLEVYVNEPSECKWSREDRDYPTMENTMQCSTQLWEMNNRQVYTCKMTLTGLENRKENNFYFKCKDQPWSSAGDRNENKQSYKYTVIGTQSLTILHVSPNQTIFGATDTIPVFLEIKTDNGYSNGEALCYYYNDAANHAPENDEAYVLFHETKSSLHKQRQDLRAGEYIYYFKCLDLGGNAAYTSTKFRVATDRAAPQIVRAYHDNDLTIITDESASCRYSQTNCNFEIESGIALESFDFKVHHAPWDLHKKYYIRCKDSYGNQPNPNVCSIIVRPSLIASIKKETKNQLDFSF